MSAYIAGQVVKLKNKKRTWVRLIERRDRGWKTIECTRDGATNGGTRFLREDAFK